MIITFKCANTKELWLTGKSRRLSSTLHRIALRKLWQLDNADSLKDLEAPPNNRLEALKHDRKGQYSIRINNQWRICFLWQNGHVYEVEIIDYH